MPQDVVAAQKISRVIKEGFEFMRNYCQARAMFINDYVGQYYNKPKGMTGDYPINLVFLAIRVLVANLVMQGGLNKITTDILTHKDYAELLGLALDKSQKQRKLHKILRAGVVDMQFGFAAFKTSIAASGCLLQVGDDINIDPGQIYTDLIPLIDLSIDPTCRKFDESGFVSHNIRIQRQKLLDDDSWDHDLVLRLPTADTHPFMNGRYNKLDNTVAKNQAMKSLQDFVYVCETYVPEVQAICYVPNPYQTSFDKFLRTQDYYGPDEGPYTFGSLTPPVPERPLPIAPVGVWRDLNKIANEIFKKIMNQSERQKDITLYRPAYADVADAVREAADGECIACDDPKGIETLSIGGQNPINEKMVGELRMWFNLMAGNVEQQGGFSAPTTTGTATEFQGLQGNIAITSEDARKQIYETAGEISKKEAWFLHTDPLMFDPSGQSGIPLTRRVTGGREVQVWLTPEQRMGDWLEFTFSIVKRSMNVMEPAMRTKLVMEFYTNVIPAVMNSALIAMQQGIQFNVPRALMSLAEEQGIDDIMMEVFEDPTFNQRMQWFAQQGPKNAGKGQASMGAIQQNGGLASARPIATPTQEFNQNAQETAGMAQSAMKTGVGF